MPARPTLLPSLLALGVAAACSSRPEAMVPALPALAAEPSPARAPRLDVLHYRVELRLLPAEGALEGVAELVWVPARERTDRLELDLDGLVALEVHDDAGRACRFEQRGGRLAIELHERCEGRDPRRTRVRFAGRPRRAIAFAGGGGGAPRAAFTTGEAGAWFPCVKDRGDLATSELSLRMPAGWTAVASGERLDSRVEDGERIELWRADLPHAASGIGFAAGEFEERALTIGDLHVRGASLPEHAAQLEDLLAQVPPALAFLEELLGGPYPGHAWSIGLLPWLAEESSGEGLALLPLEEAQAAGEIAPLVAAALARGWLGGAPAEAADGEEQRAALPGALAAYAALLQVEASGGAEALAVRLAALRELALAAPADALDTQAGARARSILRLHLLRAHVGDATFRAGLRLLAQETPPGGPTTQDLGRAMEEAAGRGLSAFLGPWFEGRGTPIVETRWRHDAARGLLLLRVDQVHPLREGTPEAFRLPAEVLVALPDGELLRRRVEVERRRSLLELEVAEPPRWVRFDAQGHLPGELREERGLDEWALVLREDPGVAGRLAAVRALLRGAVEAQETERAELVGELLRALAEDGSVAVRAAAARALHARAGGQARLELEQTARADAAPAVRAAAMTTLATWGPDEALAELAEERWAAGDPPAAAALLLAAARPAAAFDWARARLGEVEAGGAAEAALLEVIARSGDARGRALLAERARDEGASDATRAAAARGLARVAAGEPELLALLGSLLEAPSPRLRVAAVEALCAVEGEGARPLLGAHYRRTPSTRERRAIEAAFRPAP